MRSIVLAILVLYVSCATAAFSWLDCGVQLSRDIHYESASMSPTIVQKDGVVSINVKATVVDTIYNAQTRVLVWKDGELFLDVEIQDLCSIIQTTNALSCPLTAGQVISFTYQFESVPLLPTGEYVVKIVSFVPNQELGCLQLQGHVNSLKSASCKYTSYMNAVMAAEFITEQEAVQRHNGSILQIGPRGKLAGKNYGTITQFNGSPDIAVTGIELSRYVFGANMEVINHYQQNGVIYEDYNGTFYIDEKTGDTTFQPLFKGTLRWKGTIDPTSSPNWKVEGQLDFLKKYAVSPSFTYPLVLGNLGPLWISKTQTSYEIKGSHDYCTCGLDDCGVCDGDGSTCGLGQAEDDELGDHGKAAIAFGVGAFLLLPLIAYLAYRLHRARRARPINDGDLIDHPEKPDYGTMAIDDAIREGERV